MLKYNASIKPNYYLNGVSMCQLFNHLNIRFQCKVSHVSSMGKPVRKMTGAGAHPAFGR
jgi:hypothetical protein